MELNNIGKGLSLAACGAAFASSYFPVSGKLVQVFFGGVRAFAVSSIVDRALRHLLAKDTAPEKASIETLLLSPLVEESVYAGVLLSRANTWMILRLLAGLNTGMTAARSLTGMVTEEDNKKGFTLDTKIGFIWALSREFLLFTAPFSASSTILMAADSLVFGLSEVCPTKKNPSPPPKFSSPWMYKVLSSMVFRITADITAETHGVSASILQHLFFNVSTVDMKTEPRQQES